MNQYASYTFGHVLVLFKRGCVGDGTHGSIGIYTYAVLYKSLFHLVLNRVSSLNVLRYRFHNWNCHGNGLFRGRP
jgi:hypothetical protein